jgi:hypothetical protein
MKIKYVILFAFLAIAFISKAQTDTAAKLKDAQAQWVTYNNSGQSDTTVFAAMLSDYSAVLAVDNSNAKANIGLGDMYNSIANYWFNQAQPIENSNPSQYNTYMQQSNAYSALAAPYLQNYLTITGVTH